MLMKPDKKRAATLIVSSLREKAVEAPKVNGAEQDYDPCLVAAEEIIAAVESKDAAALAEALKALLDMYSPEEESEA